MSAGDLACDNPLEVRSRVLLDELARFQIPGLVIDRPLLSNADIIAPSVVGKNFVCTNGGCSAKAAVQRDLSVEQKFPAALWSYRAIEPVELPKRQLRRGTPFASGPWMQAPERKQSGQGEIVVAMRKGGGRRKWTR